MGVRTVTGLQGFVLGIIQGLTEFLPVSSSGHLVIGRTLFGLETQPLPFEVAVHGATLLAVLVYFRRRLADMILGAEVGYMGKLVLATVPIVITAIVFRGVVERVFQTPLAVAVLLAVTGTVLLSLRFKARPDMRSVDRAEPTWMAAWLIGCAQAVALMPGISRSGVTIVAALGWVSPRMPRPSLRSCSACRRSLAPWSSRRTPFSRRWTEGRRPMCGGRRPHLPAR
jgi:undecaprenyl-diphosphatase